MYIVDDKHHVLSLHWFYLNMCRTITSLSSSCCSVAKQLWLFLIGISNISSVVAPLLIVLLLEFWSWHMGSLFPSLIYDYYYYYISILRRFFSFELRWLNNTPFVMVACNETLGLVFLPSFILLFFISSSIILPISLHILPYMHDCESIFDDMF